MAEYGDCIIRRDGDKVIIDRADDLIGIHAELLHEAGGAGVHMQTDRNGWLHLAHQVVYRPVRFDRNGTVVVCERVRPCGGCEHYECICGDLNDRAYAR